jgi:hypothetical protein
MILGSPAPNSITAGTAESITTSTTELGKTGKFQLGRFMIHETGSILARGFVTTAGIEIGSDRVTSGYIGAQMFAVNATNSPRFGHTVQRQETLKVTLDCNATSEYLTSWTPSQGPGPEALRGGRSLVAMGQSTAPASLAAAGSVELTITAVENAGMIGRLFIQDVGANDELANLYITSVFLNGDRIFSGNVSCEAFKFDAIASPLLGRGMSIQEQGLVVTIVNGAAANAALPVIACSVIG